MAGCVENPLARVVRPATSITVHGRRASAPHPEVDTAPKRAPSPPVPSTAAGALRRRRSDPEDVPPEPAAPPAAMPAPLDDVDG